MEQLGRLTLPTDADVVEETLRLKNLLGADALRDCDGTEMPAELLQDPAKKYATYYTTRKDNACPMRVLLPAICPQQSLMSTIRPLISTAVRLFTRTSLISQARFPLMIAALIIPISAAL